MISMIDKMLEVYDVKTIYDQKNALKEVMQEIILCGLSRSGFFKYAAFYGGTALRIFYGLDRFSEDMDFSLMNTDLSFDLASFFPALEQEVASYGFHVTINKKEKDEEKQIQSAFLKGNTKEHLLLFYPMESDFTSVPKNEVIKIKLEVDINPPQYASFERKYRLQPIPYEVNLYDQSSLFAGKIHAVLGRAWKNRVKGRDLYDYVFYLSHRIPVNMRHLRERLLQSGHLKEDDAFDRDVLKQMLTNRFKEINYEQAKQDVSPFIGDISVIALWSSDFFIQITDGLGCREELG